MPDINDHIQRVNTKLQQILKQYHLLQRENERLKETVKNLQVENEQISRLQQQVSILKSSIGQMTESDKKTFEKQINQYIKEIDKCIGLLSE